MLTWVIVKARVDSSLNLYEHCVACDNENNCCPAVPALWGANPAEQPCGAAYPVYPAFDLRCTPLFEVLEHLESGVQPVFSLQRWPAAMRTAPSYQKQALFGVF